MAGVYQRSQQAVQSALNALINDGYGTPVVERKEAHDGTVISFRIMEDEANAAPTVNPEAFFDRYRRLLRTLIWREMTKRDMLAKIFIGLRNQYQAGNNAAATFDTTVYPERAEIVRNFPDIDSAILRMAKQTKIDRRKPVEHGSNLWIKRLTGFMLSITLLRATANLRIGSTFNQRMSSRIAMRRGGGSFVPTPSWIRQGVIVNPPDPVGVVGEEEKDRCFINACNESGLTLDYSGLRCPVVPNAHTMRTFWKRNCKLPNMEHFRLYVYYTEHGDFDRLWDTEHLVETIYCSPFTEDEEALKEGSPLPPQLNLLLLSDGISKLHWTFISDLNGLLGTDRMNPVCPYCLLSFPRAGGWFTKHMKMRPLCMENCYGAEHYPKPEDAFVYFKDSWKSVPGPWTIYADFETFVTPRMHDDVVKVAQTDRRVHRDKVLPVSAYGIYVICHFDPTLTKYHYKICPSDYKLELDSDGDPSTNLAANFLKEIIEIGNECVDAIRQRSELVWTFWDSQAYKDALFANAPCKICGLPIRTGWQRHWDKVNKWKGVVPGPNVPEPWHDEFMHIGQQGSNYKGIAHRQCIRDASVYVERESKYDDGTTYWTLRTVGFRSYTIPVFFHNLKGFDGPLILRQINNFHYMSGVPGTGEHFRTFTIDRLRFVDSLEFFQASLDEIVKGLPDAKKVHLRRYLQEIYPSYDDEKDPQVEETFFDIYSRKGEYPYEAMRGPADFGLTELPPKSAFYSKLTGEQISDEKYARAQYVWTRMECRNMIDYTEIYLMADVILLADSFEVFRDEIRTRFFVDPVHYMSLPSIGWAAAFRTTPFQQFEHSYEDTTGEAHTHRTMYFSVETASTETSWMYQHAERWIRGGYSAICHRYGFTNHSVINPTEYIQSLPTTQIVGVDVTNLYGYAMTRPLPVGDYRRISVEEYFEMEALQEFIMEEDERPFGFMLIVDYEVPLELMDKFRAYPPAPVSRKIMLSEHSPFMDKLCERFGERYTKGDETTDYLVADLHPKRFYCVHSKLHRFYLKIGLVCTEIHEIVQYRQATWLKGYVESNAEARKVAPHEYQKNVLKLMNNAVYGKTLQRDRGRDKISFAVGNKQRETEARKVGFKRFTILNPTPPQVLVARKAAQSMTMTSPIMIGACILDWSKLRMMELWYDAIQFTFGPRVRLLMTDTDSFVMQIQSLNWKEEMKDNGTLETYMDCYKSMDLLSKESDIYAVLTKKNTGSLGKLAEDYGKNDIFEFHGLNSKCYHERNRFSENQTVKHKGIKKSTRKKEIDYIKFREAVFDEYRKMIERVAITSLVMKDQKQYQQTIYKRMLSPFDRKLFLLNPIVVVPYGYSVPLPSQQTYNDLWADTDEHDLLMGREWVEQQRLLTETGSNTMTIPSTDPIMLTWPVSTELLELNPWSSTQSNIFPSTNPSTILGDLGPITLNITLDRLQQSYNQLVLAEQNGEEEKNNEETSSRRED